ncbi:MAG: hypothetical protein QF701_02710 [Nitrospinota bacterium]|nr:hypothetical protein [Nitrospinota bacterium]
MKFTQNFSGAASFAHREAEAGAQLVGFPPPEVGSRPVGLVERHHFVAGVARVVGDDRAGGIDGLHELPNHPVGVDRAFAGG